MYAAYEADTRHSVLSREDVNALISTIRAGEAAAARLRLPGGCGTTRSRWRRAVLAGRKARHTLWLSNQKLVVRVVNRFKFRNAIVTDLDLIGQANLGLAVAIQKFDPAKGCKFSTYAVYWISQYCQRYIYAGRLMRITTHKGTLITKIARAEDALYKELSRPGTPQEIANHIGERLDQVEEILRASWTGFELDDTYHATSHGGVDQFGVPGIEWFVGEKNVEEEGLERGDFQKLLDQLMESLVWMADSAELRARDREIVLRHFGYYGEPQDHAEIGADFGIGAPRVRQIVSQARKQIKERYYALFGRYDSDCGPRRDDWLVAILHTGTSSAGDGDLPGVGGD